jgi:hypothetical protein
MIPGPFSLGIGWARPGSCWKRMTREAFQGECVLLDYRCDVSYMLVINSVNMLYFR